MSVGPETRASLLLRIRDHADHIAWGEFHELYEPLIYRLARRRGLQDADARELTQDVLLCVARAVDRWEPDPSRGSFRGWLARVTRNLAVNHLLRQQRREQGSGDSQMKKLLEQQPAKEETRLFDDEFRRQTFLLAVRQVRSVVQASTWNAFWKTCVQGISVDQAGRELGMTTGAVYVSRSRVMARLRKAVEHMTRGS